jgi:signal transduction histidine kinase/CheY-like chemotaxis protein
LKVVSWELWGGISFREAQPFTESDRAFILTLGQQCAQAIARAQLYEAEKSARAEAETANRIKDEFLAVLSHELRSPLNPILGWARLLRTRKFDELITQQALETIERNAKLQTQLIEDLLDVSRILRGKLSLNVVPVNLANIVEAALETVRLSAEAKGIQIQSTLDAQIGLIAGDAARLQQIVWNLLANAIKFTPNGGFVEVHLDCIDNQAQIQITDMGKGISPQFLPYVFESFCQEDSKTTRRFGGLGLGLAIVRHLTELHGGTVTAASPGEDLGATFTVRFPLLALLDATPTQPQEASQLFDLTGLKVLAVDDEADSQALVSFTLQQAGATVSTANSVVAALHLMQQALPDVLVCDIGMPEMDGYMLLKQLRSHSPDRGGQIPAIALTAYAGENNERLALAAGFQLHLSKPVEPEKLVQAIASLTFNRQQ